MSDIVTLSVAGAAVTIPAKTLTEMWLERVRAAALPPAASTTMPGLPAIGSPWSGGIYAGIVRGDAGQRDYHLIVNTAEAEMLPWEGAKAWAANLERDGSQWSLPKRKEQAVLHGNVPELFTKEWYWSGEEYAPAAAYAWAQYFGDGDQSRYHLRNAFRARAVLHIPVGEE